MTSLSTEARTNPAAIDLILERDKVKFDLAQGLKSDVRFVPKADISRDSEIIGRRIQQSWQLRRVGRDGECRLQRRSGRLFAMSDKDFMHHVEHVHPKLFWHWCEPRRCLKRGLRIGKSLLPSRLHSRAAELEIL